MWLSFPAVAVAAGAAIAVAGAVAGSAGAWSAAGGSAVAAVFALTTVIAAYQGSRRGSEAFIAAVVLTWIAKLAFAVAAAWVASGIDALVPQAFGGALLAGWAAVFAVEVVTLVRARIPYVTPASALRSDEVI